MMFSRPEIKNTFGEMLDLKIGSDSEFRERIISYYGNQSEVIVEIPLYFAQFSCKSHFFAKCPDILYDIKKNYVFYDEKKIQANQELRICRDWHSEIKRHRFLPHSSQMQKYNCDEKYQ